MGGRRDEIDRAPLVLRALAVLDDAIRRCCTDGPLKRPQPGISLALAYLFSVSREDPWPETEPRAVFDAFWRAVVESDEFETPKQRDFRSTWAGTQFNGICRRVGVRQTKEFWEALAKARLRGAPPSHSLAVADMIRQAGEAHRDERFARIDASNCTLDRPGRKR